MVRTPVESRRDEEEPISPAPDSSVPEIVSTKKIFFLNSLSGSRRSEIPHIATAEYCPRDQVSRRLFHNNGSCDCDCKSDGCLGCLRRNKQFFCRFGVLALGILVIILLFGSLSYNLSRNSDEDSFEFELKNEWISHRHYYNISEYKKNETEQSKNHSEKETNLPVPVVEIPDDYDFGVDPQRQQYSVIDIGHNKGHDEIEPLLHSPLNTQKLNSRNPTLIINDGREPHRQKRFISPENKKKESDLVNFLNEKNFFKKASKKRNDAFMKDFINSQENIDSYRKSFLNKAQTVFEPFSLATPLFTSPLQSDEYSFEDNDIEEKLKDKFLNEAFPVWETEKPKDSIQKTDLNFSPATEGWSEQTEDWTETTEITEYSPMSEYVEGNVNNELMGFTNGEKNEAWAARNGDTTTSYTPLDENLLHTTDNPEAVQVFVTGDYERLSHLTEKLMDYMVVTSEPSIKSEVNRDEDEKDSEGIIQQDNTGLGRNETQFRTFSNIPLIQVALPFLELFGNDAKDETSSTPGQTDRVKGISLLEAKERKLERRKHLLLNSRVVGGSSDVRLPTGPDTSKPFVNAFETLKTNQQLSFTPSAASQFILPYQMCFFANPAQGSKPSFHGPQPRTFPIKPPSLLSLLDKDNAAKQSYPTQQNFLSFSINNYPHPPPSPYRQQNMPYGNSYFTFPSQPPSPFLNGQGFNKQPIFCTYLQPPLFQFPTVPGTADFSHAKSTDCDDASSKFAMYNREKFFPSGRDTMCTDETIPCRDGSSCVSIDNWCDNEVHCKDASDEAFCSCRERVTKERLCDGYVDCPQGEDEIGCFDCPKTAFSCDSVTSPESCIPLSKRCDGIKDCSAGADETECSALFLYMRQNDSFHIPQTKGFLHRNWKGDWFPVCVEVGDDTWAREACAAELGFSSQLPEVNFVPVPGHFKGPFIVRRLDGTPILQDHCKGHVSTYVACSPIKCGSRVEFPTLREFDSRFRRFIQQNVEVGNVPFVRWWNNLRKNSTKELPANNIQGELHLKQEGVRLKRGETGRVVGGKESEPRAWPWAIAVYKDGAFHCGGVILDGKWVLTAAHCMEQYWNHFYEVRGGMLRRFSFSAMEQNRAVTHVLMHENYNPNIMSSDIAVLRLQEPFSFNRWVRPACLPSLQDGASKFLWGPMPGTTCIAVGWGALRERGSDPDQLREVEVPILSRCKHKEDVAGAEICAGKFEGGKDTCQGDSGGPLLCKDSDIPPSWYVAGIVSHGEGCARPGEPGAYTRISLFVDWIAANTNDLQLPTIKPLKTCPGFRCRSGTKLCIPIKWVCNGFTDCLEAEDEKNCNSSFMKSDLFRFSKEGKLKPEKINEQSTVKEGASAITEMNINKSEEEFSVTTKKSKEAVVINGKDVLQKTVRTESLQLPKESSTTSLFVTSKSKKKPPSVTSEILSVKPIDSTKLPRPTLSSIEHFRPVLTSTEEMNQVNSESSTTSLFVTSKSKKKPPSVTSEILSVKPIDSTKLPRPTLSSIEHFRPVLTSTEEMNQVNSEQSTPLKETRTTRENKLFFWQSTEGLKTVNTNFDETDKREGIFVTSEDYTTIPKLYSISNGNIVTPFESEEKLKITTESMYLANFRSGINVTTDYVENTETQLLTMGDTIESKKERTETYQDEKIIVEQETESNEKGPSVDSIAEYTDKKKVESETELADKIGVKKEAAEEYYFDDMMTEGPTEEFAEYFEPTTSKKKEPEFGTEGFADEIGVRKETTEEYYFNDMMTEEPTEEFAEYFEPTTSKKKEPEFGTEGFADEVGLKKETTEGYHFDDMMTEGPTEEFTEYFEPTTSKKKEPEFGTEGFADEVGVRKETTEGYYFDDMMTEGPTEEFAEYFEPTTSKKKEPEFGTEGFADEVGVRKETTERYYFDDMMTEGPTEEFAEYFEPTTSKKKEPEFGTEGFADEVGVKKETTEGYYFDDMMTEGPTEEFAEYIDITTNEVQFSSKISSKKTTREAFGDTVQKLLMESSEITGSSTLSNVIQTSPIFGTDFDSEEDFESSTFSVTEDSLTETFTETSSKTPVSKGRANVRSTYFQCQKIVQSIMINYRCDGMLDCEDGTDEENCSCAETLMTKSPQLICDGRVDCPDFSDEKNCSKCSEDEFYCKMSRVCISNRERCNGVIECQHGEDEEKCFALTKTRKIHLQPHGDPVLQTKGLLITNREGDWSVECQEGSSKLGAKEAIEVCYGLGTIGYDRYQNKTLGFNCTALEVTCAEKLISSIDNYGSSNRGFVWPWNAFIYSDGNLICSAVLLKPEWLLSSTKCLENIQLEKNYVAAIFGSKSFLSKRPDTGLETIRIDALEKVPKSDMVLLHLSKVVNQSHFIRPIGIPYIFDSDPDRDVCIAVGDRTIFLNILEDCEGNKKCYRKIGSTSLMCKSKPWGGVIVCQSRLGWYPSSVFYEESGHCGFTHGVYTNLKKKIGAISSVLDKKVVMYPEPLCTGYRCSEGLCISQDKVCDGIPDCYSKEDESFDVCGKQIYQTNRGCDITELYCGNGSCIEKNLFADGIDDCGDNSDEPVNVTCLEYLQLTAPHRICDGKRNCYDKTDEDPKLCSCDDYKFECKNSIGCIPRDYVCDGEKDCPLGEDEEHCIGRKTIKSYKKTHLELMEKSYGVWHTICPSHLSKENSDILCQHLGYKEALFTYERNQTVLLPKIDSFSWVKLNRKTSIALRGDKPFVKLVKLKKICTAVKCA